MRDIEPDSPENVKESKENEAYIKMLQSTDTYPECGETKLKAQKVCDYCEKACPMCGNEVDEDTGVCFTCKETVI